MTTGVFRNLNMSLKPHFLGLCEEDIVRFVCFYFQNGMKVAGFMCISKVALFKIYILNILNLEVVTFSKLRTLFFCTILTQDIYYEMKIFFN